MNDVKITLRKMTYTVAKGVVESEIKYETEVWAHPKSVTYNEFYQATEAGYKADIIFSVYSFEYKGEEEVKYSDEVYDVVRTYSTSNDRIELTCSRRKQK